MFEETEQHERLHWEPFRASHRRRFRSVIESMERRASATSIFWVKKKKHKQIDGRSNMSVKSIGLPSGETPRTVRSQPQSSSSPAEQARVSAWATPAAEMACTKAASRVPAMIVMASISSLSLSLFLFYSFDYPPPLPIPSP